MKKVWKYPLKVRDGVQQVEMPVGAQVLTAVAQGDTPVLYALVDVTEDLMLTNRRVRLYGTDHPVTDEDRVDSYIGTVVTHNGTFVWHIFVDEEDAGGEGRPAQFAPEPGELRLVQRDEEAECREQTRLRGGSSSEG